MGKVKDQFLGGNFVSADQGRLACQREVASL
jgi:hypothetical protein